MGWTAGSAVWGLGFGGGVWGVRCQVSGLGCGLWAMGCGGRCLGSLFSELPVKLLEAPNH